MLKKLHILVLTSLLVALTCQPQTEMREMTVLIRMMDIQDLWFREKIKEFGKENGVKINVVTFDQVEDLKQMIGLEVKSGRKNVGLVKTPLEMIYPLVKEKYMIPLQEIVPASELAEDLRQYLPRAIEVATVDGKVYYLPRKLETHLLFYLKSKVDDALHGWEECRSEIDSLLREVNRYGLPAGYGLEQDPREWDFYDIAALSYFWAHRPYQGLTMPRVAHRGKRYHGTVNELVTRVFQLGGDQKDVVSMNSDPIKDFFQWESFFVKNRLYHSGMWEQAWSGGDIWGAISSGEIFMCFFHQIDFFFVHGGSDPTMTGYLSDPSDMGVAIMPRGVSLELTSQGRPLREGGHISNLSGWWWGIPVTSPDPEFSYKLARFITSRENQMEECSRFGMFPIRQDLLENLAQAFDEEWKRVVFRNTRLQFQMGTQELPRVEEWPRMGKNYLDAWYDISVKAKTVEREEICRRLEHYAKINQAILSSSRTEE